MNLQRELRMFLTLSSRRDVGEVPTCSCGAPNHARVLPFRVNGEPVTVIAPEQCELNELQLSQALGHARVEVLPPGELDAIFCDTELGHMDPFENPFGTAVYLDESLSRSEELVFCPKAFNKERGECFRVPTQVFREMTHPVLLRLTQAVTECQQ
jgi:hypothetical protein